MINYGSSYAVGRADLGVALMEFDRTKAGAFIADAVAPVVDVAKDAAKFPRIPRGTMMQTADNKIGPSGSYNRIDAKAEDDNYACTDYGLEGKIRDRDRAKYASDFDAERLKSEAVSGAMKIAREIRVATKLFDTAVWTGSDLTTDVSGSGPWATLTTDVPAQIATAKEKVRRQTGVEPNSLIVGKVLYDYLWQNTKILAKVQSTAVLTPALMKQLLAQILGLEKVIVGGQVYDAAGEEAATETVTDIWGSTYASLAIVGTAGASWEEMCVMKSFNWTPFAGIGKVTMYREEQTRSDIVRIEESTHEKVIEKYAAHLLKVA